MSMTGIGILGTDADEELRPQFTRVLKGFDSEEVEAFVDQMSRRIQSLERALDDMRQQRDNAQKRYAAVKDEAYQQAAARMAEVLRTADQEAEKLHHDAEDEANRRILDATQQADQIHRGAEAEAQRLRQEADASLRLAQTEVDRVLGGLAARREAMLAEMTVVRERLNGVMEQLEATMAVSRVQTIVPNPSVTVQIERLSDTAVAKTAEDPGGEDLLGLPEGFDLIIPDILRTDTED